LRNLGNFQKHNKIPKNAKIPNFSINFSNSFRMDFWDFVRFFKNIDRCYLGPEIMIQSENGRPATKSSHGSFDSVHANGSWSSYWETNGGGFPKGIQRGKYL
jgi:hypothetical protein